MKRLAQWLSLIASCTLSALAFAAPKHQADDVQVAKVALEEMKPSPQFETHH